MKILFKYPTRQRFKWFQKTLKQYQDMLSGKVEVKFLITCDEDDLTMNRDHVRNYMHSKGVEYHFDKHTSKIHAINSGMDLVASWDWDILYLISDDMIPQVPEFDIRIHNDMTRYYPDTDGALFYDDGLFSKDNTCTLTIMGRKLYERFGYIYHPDYKSFYCDNEYTEVIRDEMGKMIYIPEVIVKHEWSGGPRSNDALYRRNSAMGNGGVDEGTYNRRKEAGFPRDKKE